MMTGSQFDQFLTAAILICALGAMLNVGKVKSRGRSAQYLAAAFIFFGVGALLIKISAPRILIAIDGALTFGLLGADVAYRLQNPSTRHRG